MSTMNTGKFVIISFVGFVAAYKLGKYHSTTAFTTTTFTGSNGGNTKTTRSANKSNRKNNKRRNKGGKHPDNNHNNGLTVLNSTTQSNNENNTNNSNKQTQPKLTPDENLESITLKPIGKISSVYRLCVGTPRRGLLAPNSRGRIDLYPQPNILRLRP